MKSTWFAASASIAVVAAMLVACSAPTDNAERTALCKATGNTKTCSSCCNTQKSNYVQEGMTGTCTCLGDVQK
ncbi:MAG: hypothetical protein JWP97_6493 [Labilithrix sp.]|nr:hypothetical protein [Labilithrix sp.]